MSDYDAWEGYGTTFNDAPAKRAALPIQSSADFLADVPEYDEGKDYLGPFLHGGYRIHVAGPIGHGKTSFLLESVSAAVRGESLLGFRGMGGLRALYVDLEMPAELLAQAVRDARLEGHPNFDLINLPHGLRIDTHPEDAEMLEAAAEGYDLLVIDPFYQLVDQEGEYSSVRSINFCLNNIRARHPNLCVVVGFHSHEPEYPGKKLKLADIKGFKSLHNGVDIMVMFQRVKNDESRITWVKNRSPRLRVKHEEEWAVEWSRGGGFRRVDDAPSHNVVSHSDESLFA